MKKLLLLFPLLFSFQLVEAQYRFYAGLETGPKWTFTDNLIYGPRRTIESEIGFSYGMVAGTIFPKGNFIVETGFTRLSYDFKYNMEEGPYPYYQNIASRPKDFIEPSLVVSAMGIQIPLRIKSRVYHSQNNKFSLWLTGGGNFTETDYKNFKFRTNFIIVDDTIGNNLYISWQMEDQTISKPMEINIPRGGNFRNILIELGLETHYKVTDKFRLTLAGRYQGGFSTIFISNVEDTVRDRRSGTFINRVYTASNGDGVFLNIGLLYTFGKVGKS